MRDPDEIKKLAYERLAEASILCDNKNKEAA